METRPPGRVLRRANVTSAAAEFNSGKPSIPDGRAARPDPRTDGSYMPRLMKATTSSLSCSRTTIGPFVFVPMRSQPAAASPVAAAASHWRRVQTEPVAEGFCDGVMRPQ